jgi:D-ribose pyranase
MIKSGIINPQILSLIARVRHTNMLVISDRGFPFWPTIETVDISLIDGIPSVLQVFQAVTAACQIGQVYMAEEYLAVNTPEIKERLSAAGAGIPFSFEPHVDFKKRVPGAIGLIRTGDVIQYANMILVSA